ncbi:MAG TPA: NADH-quinone oxidoreductase subunit J [bacterium]|nr:NADH-quinone oxidoreductase subunit J [bacterium]
MIFDFLVISLIIMLTVAILSRSLLPAAIFLAFSSIVASVIFFLMQAMWVGIFEITIVAGLITVLFISAISLTKDLKEEVESDTPLYLFWPVFISFVFFVIWGVSSLAMPEGSFAHLGPDTFKQVLWGERKADIIGQIAIILVGIFGIAAFFRKPLHQASEASGPGDNASPTTPTTSEEE